MDNENTITIFWYIWMCLALFWFAYMIFYNYINPKNMF